MEKLRPFKGFENKYLISRSGKIYRKETMRPIKIAPPRGKGKLYRVILHDKDNSKTYNINKAIWLNFPELLPDGFVPVKGFEENYAINKTGKILSYRTCTFLVPRSSRTSPYLYVSMTHGKEKSKHYSVHRLVAKTFIPNPKNLPEVDHIDRNILNNNASNLRWTDRRGNLKNSSLGFVRNFVKCKLYKNGKFIKSFKSIYAASKYAAEQLGASFSGINKYHKSNDCEIIKCND